MIIGLLDIGNQTGALPDTLLIAADACDEEMDNTVTR
jgi:type II secretory pathway component PulF